MRIILAGAACAIAIPLAGCGEGSAFDNGFRTSFRENAVSSCVTASRNAPNASRFDWQRLCGCAIDRYMNGKSSSDLRSANPIIATLRYDGNVLAVQLRDTVTKVSTQNFQLIAGNIAQQINSVQGRAHVGFTGGTGGLSARQEIMHWDFRPGI